VRHSTIDTTQPLEIAYRDDSNVIVKGFMSTPREVARTVKTTNQKAS
jgi:hypothetical protein